MGVWCQIPFGYDVTLASVVATNAGKWQSIVNLNPIWTQTKSSQHLLLIHLCYTISSIYSFWSCTPLGICTHPLHDISWWLVVFCLFFSLSLSPSLFPNHRWRFEQTLLPHASRVYFDGRLLAWRGSSSSIFVFLLTYTQSCCCFPAT